MALVRYQDLHIGDTVILKDGSRQTVANLELLKDEPRVARFCTQAGHLMRLHFCSSPEPLTVVSYEEAQIEETEASTHFARQ